MQCSLMKWRTGTSYIGALQRPNCKNHEFNIYYYQFDMNFISIQAMDYSFGMTYLQNQIQHKSYDSEIRFSVLMLNSL